MGRWRWLVAIGWPLLACWGQAAEPEATADSTRGEPARINADKLSFDRPANMASGEGNVVIHYRDAVLRADHVRFNTETQDAWADGHVRLNRQGQEWVSPALQYNFETRQLHTEEFRGFLEPIFLRGIDLQSTATNAYSFSRFTASSCDYEIPHYRLEATSGEVYPGERLVLRNVTLRLGDVPVLWLPALALPLKEGLQPLSLPVGYSSRWGFFALASVTWPLQTGPDVTLHIDGRTERGVGVGPELRYDTPRYGRGSLRGYYLNDADPEDDTDRLLGKNIPDNRYLAQWQHRQTLGDSLALTADVTKLSDPDVLDDFFYRDFREGHESSSVLNLTRYGEAYTLSASVRPELNNFYAEVERLPEVKWSVNRLRLWSTPIFYEGESSAGYLRNHRGDTGDPVFAGESGRFDTFHQLLCPQLVLDRFSVVPRAGARYTYDEEAPASASDRVEVRRWLYNVGVDFSWKASRTWPTVRSEGWRIDGLRHIVQPFADYQWVPKPSRAPAELYQFDTMRMEELYSGESLLVTRYLPLQFPARNTIDNLDEEHTVRFGLRQKLQTRRDGVPWDLVDLEAWTDYHIEPRPGEEDFANLFGRLRFRPVALAELEVYARYDWEGQGLRELNSALRVGQGDRWRLGVGTRYLDGDSNLLSADLSCRLGRRWVAQVYQRFDFEDGEWETQEYRLRQETHDWFIDYGVRWQGQRTRDDEVTLFVAVTLRAYPDLGLSLARIDLGSGD